MSRLKYTVPCVELNSHFQKLYETLKRCFGSSVTNRMDSRVFFFTYETLFAPKVALTKLKLWKINTNNVRNHLQFNRYQEMF